MKSTNISISLDIGNTNLKCLAVFPGGKAVYRSWSIPPKTEDIDIFVSETLLCYAMPAGMESSGRVLGLSAPLCPKPISWRIIQTGWLDWKKLKSAILQVRPEDTFKLIEHKQIPLKMDVDFPEKVGIDRQAAAYAAVQKYGKTPMLIVDAGTAITVDVIQDETFRGGGILPGLSVLAKTYPQISPRLPLVQIPMNHGDFNPKPPKFPGKNTPDAIQSGLYWGAVGAIGQFYARTLSETDELRLLLTGGDAEYLFPGLAAVISPEMVVHHPDLVLAGIDLL